MLHPPEANRLDTIASDASLIEALRPYVPPPVLCSLATNGFQVSSQLREVTTMFLKLDTFDASAMAESVPLLQRFFVMAQEVLADTGGFMRQFLVDDKGCVLIAMWGVPSFTYPNNLLFTSSRIFNRPWPSAPSVFFPILFSAFPAALRRPWVRRRR